MAVAAADPRHKLAQGVRLVALGLEVADELEPGVGGRGGEPGLRRALRSCRTSSDMVSLLLYDSGPPPARPDGGSAPIR